jgi:hypothetical protein
MDKVKIAKLVAGIICLLMFLSNSFDNASDYFLGQTTLTENVETLKNLTYPSLTFCNQTGFKNTELNYNFSDYIKNTVKIEELFREPLPKELKTTYSLYNGLCFTLTVTTTEVFKTFYFLIKTIERKYAGCHAGAPCGGAMRGRHAGAPCGGAMWRRHAGAPCGGAMRGRHAGAPCRGVMRGRHAGPPCCGGAMLRGCHAAGAP